MIPRLRRYSTATPQRATVATWLVIVVRNLTVDWLRREDGRRRNAVPDLLSPLHRRNLQRDLCRRPLATSRRTKSCAGGRAAR